MFKRSGQTAAQQNATNQAIGARAGDRALAYLQAQGLALLQRNYRVARGPRARGGEIDLVMRARDGTLVFVEVRARRSLAQGGAGASVTAAKQRSLTLAGHRTSVSLEDDFWSAFRDIADGRGLAINARELAARLQAPPGGRT